MDSFYRSSYIDIDLSAILHNVTMIRKQYLNKKIIAVVKADCYGLGSKTITKFLETTNIGMFAVATLDEAIELRKAQITTPILILGVIPPRDIELAHQYEITLTIPSVTWLEEALPYLTVPVKFHIKLDTGMGRIGLQNQQQLEQVIKLSQSTNMIVITGLFTHFASADEPNTQLTQQQYQKFKQLLEFVQSYLSLEYIHAQNSASTLLSLDMEICNAYRYGIALYGYYPSNYVYENTIFNQLLPALQLKTHVVQSKQLLKGDTVSYGATYTVEQPTHIVTLPIGYADGWLRRMQGMSVIVGEEKGEIVGRICMDQCMVAVSQDYPIHTPVTLIGQQSGLTITCDEVANYANTINYEILCGLSKRLPRRYFLNNQCVKIVNDLLI